MSDDLNRFLRELNPETFKLHGLTLGPASRKGDEILVTVNFDHSGHAEQTLVICESPDSANRLELGFLEGDGDIEIHKNIEIPDEGEVVQVVSEFCWLALIEWNNWLAENESLLEPHLAVVFGVLARKGRPIHSVTWTDISWVTVNYEAKGPDGPSFISLCCLAGNGPAVLRTNQGGGPSFPEYLSTSWGEIVKAISTLDL